MNADPLDPVPPKLPSARADEAEARRLGLNLSVYQQLKKQSPTGNVEEVLRAMTAAATIEPTLEEEDIAAEEKAYRRLRHEQGIFKRRGEAPGLFKTASHAPGELARSLLFIMAYLGQIIALAIWQNHSGRKELGALWLVLFVVLGITSFLISSLIWRSLGEHGRNACRWLIRFWPITLTFLLFLLGLLKLVLS